MYVQKDGQIVKTLSNGDGTSPPRSSRECRTLRSSAESTTAVGHRRRVVTDSIPGEGQSPSRRDIENCWLALLAGTTSRDEVHDWAEPWVVDEEERIHDPMVRAAVQRLHGFDLVADSERPGVVRHGNGQEYVWSLDEIENELQSWRTNCALYDSDPQEYRRVTREQLRAYIDNP
jgi:hypothetical protein